MITEIAASSHDGAGKNICSDRKSFGLAYMDDVVLLRKFLVKLRLYRMVNLFGHNASKDRQAEVEPVTFYLPDWRIINELL